MDDSWKQVATEPETVEVSGNGHHDNGNGHYDLFGLGPAAELAPANGHVPGPVNSHREKADEPHPTLLAWAEFMAKAPVKPRAAGASPSRRAALWLPASRDPRTGRRDSFGDGSTAVATVAASAQQQGPIRSPGSDSDDRLVKQGLLTSPRNKLIWTLKREPCTVSQEGPDKGGRLWLTKVIAP